MAPFDRAHTSSYYRSIVTMSLYCVVSELERDIGRKSPILTYPTSIWRSGWSDPVEISARTLASEN